MPPLVQPIPFVASSRSEKLKFEPSNSLWHRFSVPAASRQIVTGDPDCHREGELRGKGRDLTVPPLREAACAAGAPFGAPDTGAASMRTLALLIAARFSAVVVPCAHAQIPDSLPLGWGRKDTVQASSYHLQLDRQVKHGGLSSLRIHSTSGGGLDLEDVSQSFLADDFRGQRVRLTGYGLVAGSEARQAW